jgi:YD repeat-containing protein
MKTFTFGLFLWVCSSYLYAQTPPYTLPADPTNLNIIPPAPETWAFNKYGDYPVSRETGIPNISIPLYTITQGVLTVPITLSYHASGIKVDQKAEWVGLGWDLAVGGVVSRVVKGYPDELPDGYLNRGVPQLADFLPMDQTKFQTVNRMVAGEYDYEPDEFSFSLPGASGKFYLNAQGIPVIQPFSDTKIEYSLNGVHIHTFVITTPEGIKYKFGSPTQTSYSTNFLHLSVSANTSWDLLEISSPNGTDVITFNYKNNGDVVPPRNIVTEFLKISYTDGTYTGYSKEQKNSSAQYTFLSGKVVDNIVFSTGKVVFNSEKFVRQDLTNSLQLNSIDIYGADQTTIIKGFNFNYNYFTGTGVNSPPEDNLRLKLLSVQERGKSNELKPPHEFTYLETGAYQLLPRYSFGQDHWGYANGKLNGSFLPIYKSYYPGIINNVIQLGNADRNPDGNKVKSGVIRTVKYPTGGKTEFDFEINSFGRTYSRENVTPNPYHAVIYPPTSGQAATEDIQEFPDSAHPLTEDKVAVLTYRIQNILNLVNGNMSVRLRDVTADKTILAYTDVMTESRSITVTLLAGHTYTLTVLSYINQIDKKGVASMDINWDDVTYETVTENTPVGGLRVKSIKNFDENENIVTQKFYKYTLPSDPNVSSGFYNSKYVPTPNSYVTRSEAQWYTWDGFVKKYKDVIVSLTAVPSLQGFPVGNPVTYEYVTEYSEDPSSSVNGKSVYQYALAQDYFLPSLYSSTLDRSWQRAQLLNEAHYNSSGAVVKQVTYTYETIDDARPTIQGTKVSQIWSIPPPQLCIPTGQSMGGNCTDTDIFSQRATMFLFTPFQHIVQWKRLISINEVLDGVQKETKVSYNIDKQHSNVVKAEVTGSDNKVSKTELKYAHESASTELINRNMIGIPLESNQYTETQLTGGSRVTYGLFENLYVPKKYEQRFSDLTYADVGEVTVVNHKGHPVVRKFKDGTSKITLWNRAGDKPLADILSPVTPSEITTASVLNPTYSTVPPGDMLRQDFVITHSQSVTMSTTIQDPGGVMTNTGIYTFCIVREGETLERYTHNIVGTKNQTITLPAGRYYLKSRLSLGTIQNIITQVNLQFQTKSLDFFYNGFEEGEGNSTSGDSKTGVKSTTSGYYKILTGLADGKKYVLSYWQKVSGIWTPQQSVVTSSGGSYNISLTGQVDEVRFYPQGCHMTTLAYDPLDQNLVITTTDANSLPTYYEYDSFGRLQVAKDINGNIVKSNTYHFKQ